MNACRAIILFSIGFAIGTFGVNIIGISIKFTGIASIVLLSVSAVLFISDSHVERIIVEKI